MNESCRIYEWVMSRMWTSHVPYAHVLQDWMKPWTLATIHKKPTSKIAPLWVMTHVNKLRHMWMGRVTYEWVTFYTNESCYTRSPSNDSQKASVKDCALVSNVTYVSIVGELCQVWMNHGWVISHMNGWIISESCHMYESIIDEWFCIWMNHKWVMSNTWMNHRWVISHVNKS